MTLTQGPRYTFLPNNAEVRFGPIDQLPDDLRGFPYRLELSQRHAEGWRSVGVTQLPASMLLVQVSAAALHLDQSVPLTGTIFRAPDHSVRKDLLMPAESSHSVPQKTSPTRNPSGIEPDPSKKQYCTYWIRHNSCDYMQEGCRYKHEMPDPKKLRELGFPEVPDWYKQKTGLANWLRPGSKDTHDNRQLSSQPLAFRSFRPIARAEASSQSSVIGEPEVKPSQGYDSRQPSDQALASCSFRSIATTEVKSLQPSTTNTPAVEPVEELLIDLSDTDAESTTSNPTTCPKPKTQQFPTFAASLKKDAATFANGRENLSVPVATKYLTTSHQDSRPSEDSIFSTSNQLHQLMVVEDTTKQDTRMMKDRTIQVNVDSQNAVDSPENIHTTSIKPSTPCEKSPQSPPRNVSRCSDAPAIPFGLGSSRYATAENSKKADRSSKSPKRRDSMLVHTKLPLHQCATRKSGKLGKEIRPAHTHPCAASPLARTA